MSPLHAVSIALTLSALSLSALSLSALSLSALSLSALSLSALSGAVLAVQAPPAPAPATPTVDAAAAARAAEAARLKAEYDKLTAELQKATVGFQVQVSALNQQKVPREQWPPDPKIAWYPRFEELAFQDQPDALRWCLGALGQIGVPLEQVLEKKHEIYARLVVLHPDVPWMADLARWLQSDGAPTGLGFERADELLRELIGGTTVPATRAAALSARAALLGLRPDAESKKEQERILRELAEKHADTPGGAAAKGRLFQADSLAVGKTPPDLEATDTDGKSFKLSDYRGKVLVLEFWGFW